MKRSGMTTASFTALLNPLVGLRLFAGFAVCLAGATVDLGATGGLPASALPAQSMTVPFTEHVISTAAQGAFFVFAVDLDSDGDTDVLSASFDDDKIAWYESDPGAPGPPTFTERVISIAANGAVSVFATDVDSDGDIDVLSASENDNKIAWYESDGGSPPSFTERVISTTAEGAASVFATDVDRDGDTDILSASFFDDKIAWYESDGGSPPSFTEHVISTTTAVLATTVFATDLDGDGDIDVLSASWEGVNVAWYENDGDSPPSFTERVISTTADGATSVFATDVDGDGDTDVLSASFGENKIAWYESDGGSPPIFTERVISLTADGAAAVFATDVDGDGDTDVLSASFDDNKILWYESDGGSPPTFTERVISITADGAASLFATDVDRDGDIDVLSASLFDNKIAWYENLSPCGFDADCDDDVDAGDFASFQAVLTGPLVTSTMAGAVGPPFGGSASAISAQGTNLPFTERVISTVANEAWSVFAADLDGDGDTDVLSASFDDDKIAWYESNGGSPPSFTERVISTTVERATSVFATDLDGDGDTDVLSTSLNDNNTMWYESDGGLPPSFTERVISTTTINARSVFATDLDADGDTDVLSASTRDDNMKWYENDGGSPPAFTERVLSTTAVIAFSVFATDLDGDGDTDVLSAAEEYSLFSLNAKIWWYESDGGSPPSFTERVISTTTIDARSLFAKDLDGDGDTDVLCASRVDSKIAWYESDGGSPPTFTEWVISTSALAPLSVFATDVDGDGNIDVLSASGPFTQNSVIAWYESDGGSPPAFTERVISTAANATTSVFATDVDGDGDTDVLSASLFDDKIAWYENLSPCGFDSDCDGDADLHDFASFQIQFTGSK